MRKMTLAGWVDAFEAELRSPETVRSYRAILWKFLAAHPDHDPEDITREDCELFLAPWRKKSPATFRVRWACLNSFFKFILDRDAIEHNPMERVRNERKIPFDELDVKGVSTEQVLAMLGAVETWPEAITMYLAVYTGARRHGLAQLRWRDIDLEARTVSFAWKGRRNRRHELPLADDVIDLLQEYNRDFLPNPDDYVIPNKRPAICKKGQDRQDRIVYDIVRDVAAKAGVDAHVHALRAAFAVFCRTHLKDDLLAIQRKMGHRSSETTQVYLRRLEKADSLENLHSLTWKILPTSTGLPESRAKAHTGFEPVFPSIPTASTELRESDVPRAMNPVMLTLIERLRNDKPVSSTAVIQGGGAPTVNGG